MTDTTALAPVTTTFAEIVAYTYPAPSQNPARVYIASLSEGSRATMFSALANLAAWLTGQRPEAAYPPEWAGQVKRAAQEQAIDALPWHTLRFQHTAALRTLLQANYEATTANKMLTALRQTIKAAWGLGLLDTEDYMKACNIKAVKGQRPEQAAGRALTYGEVMAIIAASNDGTVIGARDTAIFATGLGGGLRRSELAHLQLADYKDGTLTVSKGKRNKTRIVPLPQGAQDALADWIDLRGDWPGPLFARVLRGDHMRQAGITPGAIQLILDTRRVAAGVEHFTPHDLRRTFAGDLLDANVDISTVQKLMGHDNPATTASYDRRGSRARVDAVKHLHIPYQRRKKP